MGKSVGTGYHVWAELEAAPDLLDAPIRPLVEALNQTGWAQTVFSCAGHPEEPDSVHKGRRQAHIDLLVSDLKRWQTVIRSLPRTPNLRITEAPLGPIPPWLADQRGLGATAGGPGEQPSTRAAGNGGGVRGRRAGRSVPRPAEPQQAWHYRRLVFEPNPYDMPPARCRESLDTALTTATQSLQSLNPHTSHANTH